MKTTINLKKAQQYPRIFEIIKSQTFAANCEEKSNHSICIHTCLFNKNVDDYKIILIIYNHIFHTCI